MSDLEKTIKELKNQGYNITITKGNETIKIEKDNSLQAVFAEMVRQNPLEDKTQRKDKEGNHILLGVAGLCLIIGSYLMFYDIAMPLKLLQLIPEGIGAALFLYGSHKDLGFP